LGKHKLIHNPNKRYRCEECQRPFTQKIHLKKHLEKHHPDLDIDVIYKIEPAKDEGSSIIFEECIVDGVDEDEEDEVDVEAKDALILGK
jgi:hypothetical protein